MPDHYSARFIRFVLVPDHAEAYEAAYLDQSSASTHELQRLHREFVTKPPRHVTANEATAAARATIARVAANIRGMMDAASSS